MSALFLLVWQSAAHAQLPPGAPPPGTPPAEVQRQIEEMGLRDAVIERIRQSGLTPEQIRAKLVANGYDATTLDPYMASAALMGPPPPDSDRIDDLRVPPADTSRPAPAAQAKRIDDLLPDSSAEERAAGLRVFGLEVFAGAESLVEPGSGGPVPADYIIGPGDELILVLTGDVEVTHQLPVTRDGFILVPQVGQIWVNGLTLDALRDRLYGELGRAYSGVSSGPDATTFFDVSLGRLRANQVYVTGEVRRPGSYFTSSVASLLNALYLAGGITPNGSFRDVRIMRAGRQVASADLYEFLLAGNNMDALRLQPGDVVFVPVFEQHVAVRGEVKREALFELLPGETLADVLRFAGGLTAPAQLRRARITRLLPGNERVTPGTDRVVMDVNLLDVVRSPESAPRLSGGDEVQIFAVRNEVRNVVTLEGSVWLEGTFGYRPGMRAADLIELGQGLRPDAYTTRGNIMRLDPSDSTISVVPFSLERDATGAMVDNPELREFDVLRIYSKNDFTESFPISIQGEVVAPIDSTEFQEGITLRDMILRAGGLKPTADLTVEIARLSAPSERAAGEIVNIYSVELDSSYFVSDHVSRHYLGDRAAAAAQFRDPAAELVLRPYDKIFVRRIADFEYPRAVKVAGEVRYPGEYVLKRKDERLREMVLGRAGGIVETGFTDGFQLYRDGDLVNVDLPEVLENPGHRDNVILLPGDSLYIPEYNPVVEVRGAVYAPTTVMYKKGAGLDYYIENAGGFRKDADDDHVRVRYANGSGRVTKEFMFINFDPEPGPGSVVTVPALSPEDRHDWRGTITSVAQVIGSLGTVIAILRRN